MPPRFLAGAFAALLLVGPVLAAPNPPPPDGAAQLMTISTHGAAGARQRIVLPLNKAAIVQLDVDARDVLVSDPDIVNAVVRTPRRIFLLASKTGQTNAFFFDAAGQQVLSLDIQVEKDVTDLSNILKTDLSNSAITVGALNDNVVLSGTVSSALESTHAETLAASFAGDPKKVVNLLKVAGGEQVMLKVRVAEMDRIIAKQFGIDLSSAASVGGVPIIASTSNPYGLLGQALSNLSGAQVGSVCSGAFTPNTTTSTTTTLNTGNSTVNTITNGINQQNISSTNPELQEPGIVNGVTTIGSAVQTIASALAPTVAQTMTTTVPCSSANNMQGVLKALEQVGLVHTLAEPTLIAVSGETAKVLSGGSFPVPSGRDQQGNVSVEFKDYGVMLSFTPVVIDPGRISIQVSTEASELTNTGAYTLAGSTTTINGTTVTTPGVTIPALDVRRADTTVELPSGGSFSIAGLMQHVTKQEIDGFPGLKDLPMLGALFRSRDYQDNETELVVVVSAYLVQPTTEAALAAPTDGFVAPSDPETILLGRLNAVYKDNTTPLQPQASAPVGFVVR